MSVNVGLQNNTISPPCRGEKYKSTFVNLSNLIPPLLCTETGRDFVKEGITMGNIGTHISRSPLVPQGVITMRGVT